jgi:hypothetical protein
MADELIDILAPQVGVIGRMMVQNRKVQTVRFALEFCEAHLGDSLRYQEKYQDYSKEIIEEIQRWGR